VTRVANTTLADEAGEAGARHLGIGSTLGELLRHSAFAGYARRLLLRDDVAIDETLPIGRISSLLPYHSHVVLDVVLGALNHLIDEVGRGTPVFHELYTPAEQQGDPTKASTGRVFFRGRPGAPFALVAPGGGFSYAGSVHECSLSSRMGPEWGMAETSLGCGRERRELLGGGSALEGH
jgi:hypothetical protein